LWTSNVAIGRMVDIFQRRLINTALLWFADVGASVIASDGTSLTFSKGRQRALQSKGQYRREMISMLLWLTIYLCCALVAAAGASVAADLLSERDAPSTARTRVIVFAGMSWPVLLVGLLQLICIGGLANAASGGLAAHHVSRLVSR
jgi:hypothetical protein